MRRRVRTLPLAVLAVLLTVPVAGCGKKNVNTVVAETADYGTLLMKGIKATATAVAAAEAQNPSLRNQSIAVMQKLQIVTAKGEEAGRYMKLMLDAQGTAAEVDAKDKLQTVLDFIDSELFNVLVPVADPQLKTNLAALLTEVSRTIGLIQREVLGRVK